MKHVNNSLDKSSSSLGMRCCTGFMGWLLCSAAEMRSRSGGYDWPYG